MESSSITALKLLMAVGFNKRTAATYHHIASLCARPSCFTAPCCIRRELVVCIPSAGDFVSHDVPTVSLFLMARTKYTWLKYDITTWGLQLKS